MAHKSPSAHFRCWLDLKTVVNLLNHAHIWQKPPHLVVKYWCDSKDLTYTFALRWRHNGRDSVSNHQPHGCLLNRLYRRRSKKTLKLRVTGLCAGIHRRPLNSPHKWPVTRKMFPFDDVIMVKSRLSRTEKCPKKASVPEQMLIYCHNWAIGTNFSELLSEIKFQEIAHWGHADCKMYPILLSGQCLNHV